MTADRIPLSFSSRGCDWAVASDVGFPQRELGAIWDHLAVFCTLESASYWYMLRGPHCLQHWGSFLSVSYFFVLAHYMSLWLFR